MLFSFAVPVTDQGWNGSCFALSLPPSPVPCMQSTTTSKAVARGEDAELGEVLEAAAASSLREISHHPELVGLLLRRWGSRDGVRCNVPHTPCWLMCLVGYTRLARSMIVKEAQTHTRKESNPIMLAWEEMMV